MDKTFGIILRHKKTNELIEYWFYTIDERERFINFRCKNEYEIVEFIGEQTEFNFDLRN